MEFYSTLDQLLNPTNDLGGGPGAGDASALAKLILGGGQASMGGTQLLGAGKPVDPVQEAITRASMGGFGVKPDEQLAQAVQSGQVDPAQVLDRNLGQAALAPAPAAAPKKPMSSNLENVLDTADQIAGSLGSKNAVGDVITKTLLPNPYGAGSYDPRDPDAVAKVQAAGEQAQKVQNAQSLIAQLGNSNNPLLRDPKTQGSIVSKILEDLGIVQSDEAKAAAIARGTARGKAEGEGMGQGTSSDIDVAAKKLANYEMPVSALARMPANKRLAILNKAEELSPGFDLKQYETRQKVMNSYSSGRDKDNIVRLNTAVDHLEKLKEAGDALQNGGVRAINALKNMGREQTGDPRVRAYKDAAQAVAGEMAAVFKNGTGTDVEIKKWLSQISAADSPEQIQANFDMLVGLMRGRVDALDANFESAMGKKYPGIFSKKAQGIIKKLGSYDLGSNSVESETTGNAPAKAVEMLRSNPTPQMKQFFKEKFGYLPEGM